MRGVWFDRTLSVREDLARPAPAPGEALVRVSLAGICRTDLEILRGYMGFRGIPGHEFVGRVEAPAESPLAGRRVVGEINAGCGACADCAAGDPRHCAARTVLGIAGRDGAFADYLTLPARNLHVVPDAVADREAVFAEPVAAAFEILEQRPDLAEPVLVVGDGKLGLLVAAVLARSGRRVVLGAKRPERARAILGPRIRVEPSAEIDGIFPAVVEATGRPEGWEIATARLAPRGTLVLKSTYHGRPAIDLAAIVIAEWTVLGSRCGPFAPAIEALAARDLPVEKLVEAEYPLDRAAEAFERASRPGALKVLLRGADPRAA
ncbi:MAG: alcohol dehydrogenase catalytic domain-containing protein [Planctomycetes bacterium]|nr:alcohol dehydrogenase catalytic domain-containing protein [Planctomycetota bacterium]